MIEVEELANRLIAAPSVTPATGLVFDVFEAMLAPLGFEVHRFTRGDGEAGTDEASVENCFAIRRGPAGKPHSSRRRRGRIFRRRRHGVALTPKNGGFPVDLYL